eukprot:SAG11_NODE_187_length_13061_cov_10.715322_9_plen_67_part_00
MDVCVWVLIDPTEVFTIRVSFHSMEQGHKCDIQSLSPGSRSLREVGGLRSQLVCRLREDCYFDKDP